MSGTICDVVSLSHIIAGITKLTNIKSLNLVTLHPWLSYQNLVDGPVKSVSSPGHLWPDFALGRASSQNLIPKDTTAFSVLKEIFPELPYKKFQSMSFRVPTPTVTCGILNCVTTKPIKEAVLHDMLRADQSVEIVDRNLVSSDYVGVKFSTSIDTRWTEYNNGNLRIISWYDNEYGYSAQIIRLVTRLFEEC